jgi:hypothetical protein
MEIQRGRGQTEGTKFRVHKTNMEFLRPPKDSQTQAQINKWGGENSRRNKCRLRCLACKYVFVQCGHGNFPSASLTGTTVLLGPDAPAVGAAGRPGALGSIPRRP